MKMLYCRKCGAAMFTDEALSQNILDQMSIVIRRAKRANGKYKSTLLQEAAGYHSMYKALMHNITQREYAETVTPFILKALTDEVKNRKLLTDKEIDVIYERGKTLAKVRKREAEKQEREIYGAFETIVNSQSKFHSGKRHGS